MRRLRSAVRRDWCCCWQRARLASYWLLYTQPGLQFALSQLQRIPNVRIEVTGARGTLAGPLAADQVVVDHEAVHIVARGVRVDPDTSGLFVGHLGLDELTVASADVRLKQRPPRPESSPHFLPAGLRIDAPEFRLGPLALTLQNGQRVGRARRSRARSKSRAGGWTSIRSRCADPTGRITGSLALLAREPLGLRTDLRGEWRLPGRRIRYRFRVATRGNLDRLGIDL